MELFATVLITAVIAVIGGYILGRLTSRQKASDVVADVPDIPATVRVHEPMQPNPLSKRLYPPTGDRTGTDPSNATLASSMRRHLIVVSYRLPIVATKVKGEWIIQWDKSQGPIVNLKMFSQEMDITYVGYPNVEVPREEQDDFETQLEAFNCMPVYLDSELHSRFFDGFCKGVLWPLMHYLMPAAGDDFALKWDSLWQAYTTVNMMYSRKVTLATKHDEADTIWVHNYHLLLVPSFIRKKLSRARIGLFLHTPFPTSDVFRCLPGRTNILRGVLCADLLGFHTYDYARHFLSACKRVLDLDFEALPGGALGIVYCGRSVSIRISHMGITKDEFDNRLHSEVVIAKKSEIIAEYGDRKLIIAVDEFDVVKGALIKLQAYERFLSSHSEWAEKVSLIVLVTPSLNSLEERESIKSAVLKETSVLQKKFGPQSAQVIELTGPDLDSAIAYFAVSHVGLFTSFWDGLNILPFEYTAAQDASNPGVLIVSEFMGCSRSLNGVIRLNPLDLDEAAEALSTALVMTQKERTSMHTLRHKYVLMNDYRHWAQGFIADLDESSKQSEALNYVQVGWGSGVRLVGIKTDFRHLNEGEIVASYRSFKSRLLLFDYDGTLSTIPDQQPAESTLQILGSLCEDPNNVVFILSGRERSRLSSWFGNIPRLGIAAEKGVYIKWPGAPDWEALPNLGDFSWKETALDLMKSYAERTDGAYVEVKESALVWHYHNADPEHGRSQASELGKYIEKILESSHAIDVVRYDLNRILEVKPRGVSKGITARKIVSRMRGESGLPHFLLCIGDDRSDEDTFLALQSGSAKSKGKTYTVCVGLKPSNANFYLHDTAEVLKILHNLSLVSINAARLITVASNGSGSISSRTSSFGRGII